MLKRFFAWIGRLMRRRPFGQWGSTTAVVIPPVTGTLGRLLFNLPAQSALLALLEDI